MELILYNIYKRASFNPKKTFCCIDDVLSWNNPKFNDYIDVIYTEEDTTADPKWSNYLDIHLEFDEDGYIGKLVTPESLKACWFDFPIVKSSNIPESPAYVCFCFIVDTLCSHLFEIWRFSVQRI